MGIEFDRVVEFLSKKGVDVGLRVRHADGHVEFRPLTLGELHPLRSEYLATYPGKWRWNQAADNWERVPPEQSGCCPGCGREDEVPPAWSTLAPMTVEDKCCLCGAAYAPVEVRGLLPDGLQVTACNCALRFERDKS